MLIPLSSMCIDSKGIITRIDLNEDIKDRLLSMGIIPGKKISLVHVSPFKDPYVYKIEDNKIMLRKSEANKIFVELSEEISSMDNCKKGKYQLLSILGGFILIGKLKRMGLKPGNEVEIIENNGGKILINVKGKTISIGKGQSKKILLKSVD